MQLRASVQLIAVYWRDGNRGWAHAAMALLAVDYSVGVVVTAARHAANRSIDGCIPIWQLRMVELLASFSIVCHQRLASVTIHADIAIS